MTADDKFFLALQTRWQFWLTPSQNKTLLDIAVRNFPRDIAQRRSFLDRSYKWICRFTDLQGATDGLVGNAAMVALKHFARPIECADNLEASRVSPVQAQDHNQRTDNTLSTRKHDNG
jgi:hypothetical protein